MLKKRPRHEWRGFLSSFLTSTSATKHLKKRTNAELYLFFFKSSFPLSKYSLTVFSNSCFLLGKTSVFSTFTPSSEAFSFSSFILGKKHSTIYKSFHTR